MRTLSTLCVLTLFGCASAGVSPPADANRNTETAPLSNFDYVVLASLADAGRPISLAAYAPSQSHD